MNEGYPSFFTDVHIGEMTFWHFAVGAKSKNAQKAKK